MSEQPRTEISETGDMPIASTEMCNLLYFDSSKMEIATIVATMKYHKFVLSYNRVAQSALFRSTFNINIYVVYIYFEVYYICILQQQCLH